MTTQVVPVQPELNDLILVQVESISENAVQVRERNPGTLPRIVDHELVLLLLSSSCIHLSMTRSRSSQSRLSFLQNFSISATFQTACSQSGGSRFVRMWSFLAASSTSALRVHDLSISHVPWCRL